MRVTQNGVVGNLLAELNKNRSKYSDLSLQLSSQKRVNRPSDDALAFGNAEEKKSVIERNVQFQSNLDNGIEQSKIAEESISLMLEQLFELKTLATRGANGSANSLSDMDTLADSVASVRTRLVQLGNVQANGRYIFSGTATQTPPFEEAGTNVNYNGNAQNLEIKANPANNLNVSVTGSRLIDYNGGETVYDLIERIETALRSGDSAAVNAELDNIGTATEYVARMGGTIGNSINQMEFAYEHYEATNITLKSQVSRLVDADYAEVASKIQQLDVAYSAALSVTSRISQLSLLNYL